MGEAIDVREQRPSVDAFDELRLSFDCAQDFFPIFDFSVRNSVVAAIARINHETLNHR
jgi:hypothetical protein